jgi:predicted lipoprotein with Yx(FWY)xxD motif
MPKLKTELPNIGRIGRIGRKRTSLLAIITVMAVLALVACTDSEDPTATSAPPTATTTSPPPTAELSATDTPIATAEPSATDTPTATEVPPATTTVDPTSTSVPQVDSDEVPQEIPEITATSTGDFGDILTDSSGMTLYIFDRDTEGTSNCSGGCLNAWPPLIVDETPTVGNGVTADIGTITLADGTKQATINGFPAYYFQSDTSVGDTAGNGVGNNWWVFNADGTPQRPAKVSLYADPDMGDILSDSNGMTLYIFDRDTEGVSNCSGGCLSNWPPLLAEYGVVAVGDIAATVGTIDRGDGTMQVTINGFPAYYWKGDAAEGDTTGNGVGGVWWVFEADGSPQRPAKVSLSTNSVMGDILVGAGGRSLYIFDRDAEGVSNCSGGCLGNWPPLLAEHGAIAVGDITATIDTIDRGDGVQQVTVNGFPAYYWKGDTTEGDTTGNGVGSNWWVFNGDGTPQRPAKVNISTDAEMGDILVGANGLSLYIFDRDTDGVSNCSGGCLGNWPPLLTEYGAVAIGDVTGTVGTIDRGDGTTQVTINGFPAYYWKGDVAEGDTTGNGVGSVWWIFNSDGTPQRPAKVGLAEHTSLGSILTDGAGMSLYLFDNDTPGMSNCSGGCLASWPALLTEHGTAALQDVTGTLGTITRGDGSVQVTVNDMPVYYWANDAAAGDAGGHSLGSVWWLLNAEGNAIRQLVEADATPTATPMPVATAAPVVDDGY